MRVDSEFETRSGHRKSFHAPRNVKTVKVAIPGAASGSTMRRRIWNSDAPSKRAASRMESGMEAKNCRMRKMPKTWTAPGAIIPESVSRPRKGTQSWSHTIIL